MRLYLVRHGDAVSDSADPERPLSDAGIKEVQKSADFLKRVGSKPSGILCSTKLRAKQTAEIISKTLGGNTGVKEVDFLSPSSNPLPFLELLEREKQDILIAGHLPYLNIMAGILLIGSMDIVINIKFYSGGIACLERTEDQWKLMFLVNPGLV